MDTLQVFLNYYFPNLDKSARLSNSLVKDMNSLGLSLKNLKEYYDKNHEVLDKIVDEVLDNTEENGFKWYQASSAITLLELSCPAYVEKFGIRTGMEEFIKSYIK